MEQVEVKIIDEELIKSLQTEKEEIKLSSEAEGVAIASFFIEEHYIGYKSFVIISEIGKQMTEKHHGSVMSDLIMATKESENDALKGQLIDCVHNHLESDFFFDADRFAVGFIKMVTEVWNEIETEV